jgi:hypothetical protein
MLRRFAFLLLLATASKAMAGQAALGDVSVNLPPPAGFCELSDSKPADTRMLSIMRELLSQSGDKLLAASADCEQLAGWRTARRPLLDDYAQYQVELAQIDRAPDESIQQACATLRAEDSKILPNELPDIKARIAAVLKKVKINQSAFIGVLAEEPRACYAGLILQIHTEAGIDKTQLTLFAVTAVKNRRVFVYRFMMHTGPDSVDSGLAKLKSDVAAFYAAN